MEILDSDWLHQQDLDFQTEMDFRLNPRLSFLFPKLTNDVIKIIVALEAKSVRFNLLQSDFR